MSIFYEKPRNTFDFVHYIMENPGVFITQILENSEKYPGKPLKTLEFELKTLLATLYCHKFLKTNYSVNRFTSTATKNLDLEFKRLINLEMYQFKSLRFSPYMVL